MYIMHFYCAQLQAIVPTIYLGKDGKMEILRGIWQNVGHVGDHLVPLNITFIRFQDSRIARFAPISILVELEELVMLGGLEMLEILTAAL